MSRGSDTEEGQDTHTQTHMSTLRKKERERRCVQRRASRWWWRQARGPSHTHAVRSRGDWRRGRPRRHGHAAHRQKGGARLHRHRCARCRTASCLAPPGSSARRASLCLLLFSLGTFGVLFSFSPRRRDDINFVRGALSTRTQSRPPPVQCVCASWPALCTAPAHAGGKENKGRARRKKRSLAPARTGSHARGCGWGVR